MLRHGRQKRAGEDATSCAATAAVSVDLLTGVVLVRGVRALWRRLSLSVVLALATRDRPVLRDELAEDPFPGASHGANTLKVNVHRVRRRLGIAEAIRNEVGRYALGWCVDVDLPRVAARVRAMRRDGFQCSQGREYLLAIRRRLAPGRPACTRTWSWFEPTERLLSKLWYEVTMMLAQAALRDCRYDDVLKFTTEVLAEDPLDEMATEIAIRASVLCDDRIGAVVQIANTWSR